MERKKRYSEEYLQLRDRRTKQPHGSDETFQYLFLNLKPQPWAGKGANVSHYMGLMIWTLEITRRGVQSEDDPLDEFQRLRNPSFCLSYPKRGATELCADLNHCVPFAYLHEIIIFHFNCRLPGLVYSVPPLFFFSLLRPCRRQQQLKVNILK